MLHALRHVVAVTAITLVALFVHGIALPAQKADDARIQELRQQLKDKEAEIAKHRETIEWYRDLLRKAETPLPKPVTDEDRLKHKQELWVELLLAGGSLSHVGLISAWRNSPEEDARRRASDDAQNEKSFFEPRLEAAVGEAVHLMEEWHLIEQELAAAEGRPSVFQTQQLNSGSPLASQQRQVGVVSVLTAMDDPISVLSSNDLLPPRGPIAARDLWASLAAPFASLQAPRSSSALPLPSAKVFFTSLGRSSGEAVRMTVVNDGAMPIRIRGDAFALVPLANVTPKDVEREMKKLAGRNQVTVNIEAFCLDFHKPPPTAGMVMGLADYSVQAQMGPIHQMVRAVRRLHKRGALGADSSAKSRAQTMLQWAIWTREQQFDEAGFSRAFVEHAKKNIAAAGRKWTRDLEQAVTALTPQRWADIQMLLREAATTEAAR